MDTFMKLAEALGVPLALCAAACFALAKWVLFTENRRQAKEDALEKERQAREDGMATRIKTLESEMRSVYASIQTIYEGTIRGNTDAMNKMADAAENLKCAGASH